MRRPSPQQDDTRTTVQLRHPTLACLEPSVQAKKPGFDLRILGVNLGKSVDKLLCDACGGRVRPRGGEETA